MSNNARIQAMKWWNSLSDENKQHLCSYYKHTTLGYERDFNSLTGREIQNIYELDSSDSFDWTNISGRD